MNPILRRSLGLAIGFLTVAGLMTPTTAAAVPGTVVSVTKSIVQGQGKPFWAWTPGHNGKFSIVVTNTTEKFRLYSGKYVVHEQVPPGLTVTSIGGSGPSGSWSCTPPAPQTGPVTITCVFDLKDWIGPHIWPGQTLPPILVGVQVTGAPDPIAEGYENCATLETTASDIDGVNPSCVTAKPLPVEEGSAVCAEKFVDYDADGLDDPAEPLLSGVRFVLRDATYGRVVGRLVSSATETACVSARPGRYVLTERPTAGWEPTNPRDGSRAVRLRAGRPVLATFGNRPDSQLCVRKFEDLDADGELGPDEPDLPGWEFVAASADGTVTLLTGGERTCAWVPPGTYTVSEVEQAGWTPTAPASGVRTIEVEPTTSALATFGNVQTDCCLTFTHLGGAKDDFSTAGPAEPATPPTSADPQRFFDETKTDAGVAHRTTFGAAGNCIADATLTVRLMSLRSDGHNDTLTVHVPGSSPKHIAIPDISGTSWMHPDPPQTFSLDLDELPDGSSIISALDATRVIDVAVQDDTSVDYVEFAVTYCECDEAPTSPIR